MENQTEHPTLYDMDNKTKTEIENIMSSTNTMTMVKTIILPIFLISGFTGNTLSLVVFSFTPMKNFSCSTILAAMSVVDNIFLVNILMVWLDLSFPTDIMNTNVACQVIVYASYVSGFLSIWFVVALTVERYIAICHPFAASRLCGKTREKYVIIIITLCACLLYNFALWTSSIQTVYGRTVCLPKKQFFNFINIMTCVDSIVTGLVPLVIILFTTGKIIYKICQYEMNRSKLSARQVGHLSGNSSSSNRSLTWKSKSQRKITRLLMLVSVTFCIFVIPGHILRLRQLSAYMFKIKLSESRTTYLLNQVFQILYYFTFCMNFYLYAVSGKFFRKYLTNLIAKRNVNGCGGGSTCTTKTSSDRSNHANSDRYVSIPNSKYNV